MSHRFHCIKEFKLVFTSYKVEQPLWGIDLQKIGEEKDEEHMGKLFSKNWQIKDAT